jgi:MFS family permease
MNRSFVDAMTARRAQAPSPARARCAVSLCFFVNGVVFASWVPHIPDLKSRLGISDGGLGLVLLSMAVGAVLALPAAGWLIGRLGSRAVTAASALGLSAAVVFPVIAPTVMLSVMALSLFGACTGLLDVSINAQAVIVEEKYDRPIMSSFHALFSLGGLVGAAGAALAMMAGLGSAAHVGTIALLSLGAVAIASRDLEPAPSARPSADPVFVWPPAVLMGLGLLSFAGLLAEGAMGDWSAVYLRDSVGSTPAVAAMGFAAFSLAMAIGRFCGDWLTWRIGPVSVLRASGGLAAVGLTGALVVAHPVADMLGFGVMGLGIANLIPVLFSAAGRAPGIAPGTALAAVATTGYAGYLAGPPLIGLAAELIGLRGALGIVSLACGMVAVTATLVSRPRATLSLPRLSNRAAATHTTESSHA